MHFYPTIQNSIMKTKNEHKHTKTRNTETQNTPHRAIHKTWKKKMRTMSMSITQKKPITR